MAGFLVLLVVSVEFYYQQEKEFTPWMDSPTIDAYLASLSPPKESGKKNYWDQGHWIYAVEARLRNEVVEYRVKYGDAPSRKHARWWYWYVNMSQDSFDNRNQSMIENGFILAYKNHYTGRDEQRNYQAVWQKVR